MAVINVDNFAGAADPDAGVGPLSKDSVGLGMVGSVLAFRGGCGGPDSNSEKSAEPHGSFALGVSKLASPETLALGSGPVSGSGIAETGTLAGCETVRLLVT